MWPESILGGPEAGGNAAIAAAANAGNGYVTVSASGDETGAEDIAAITAALATKRILLKEGDYYLGSYSSATTIFNLSSLGDDVEIKTEGVVRFYVEVTADVIVNVFYLALNNNFKAGRLYFVGEGYDSSKSNRGAVAVVLGTAAVTGGNWGNVAIEEINCTTCLACFNATGGDASYRIRGIKIGTIVAEDCYYGIECQNQGDGLEAYVRARSCYRPYFVYGVSDHRVRVSNRENRLTTGACNISRVTGGLNTRGIEVAYSSRDTAQDIAHVLIAHTDLSGGTIEGIKVHVDIHGSTGAYYPVKIVNYSSAVESSSSSSNNVGDIVLSGSHDSGGRAVTVVGSYATKRQMTFMPGYGFTYGQSVVDKFYLNKASRGATCTWSAAGTAPAIGNGTCAMWTDYSGNLARTTIVLTAGSTTTFGTGAWSFTLPHTATTRSAGSAIAVDSSASATYAGACLVAISGSTVSAHFAGTTTAIDNAAPFAWASGDTLTLSIVYTIT